VLRWASSLSFSLFKCGGSSCSLSNFSLHSHQLGKVSHLIHHHFKNWYILFSSADFGRSSGYSDFSSHDVLDVDLWDKGNSTYWSHFNDQVSENIQTINLYQYIVQINLLLLGVSNPFYRHSFKYFHQLEYCFNNRNIISTTRI